MSPVEEFKRNLEYFYNGARCYFALRQISDGEDCDYLSLWEDGGHFDGIQIFNKYRHPVMNCLPFLGHKKWEAFYAYGS